ncbi:hypothetical protein WN55_04068 [Dufourea novaeangliae]|uniref:Uncharacterized protein n=1 Tax=Dufourea novaeangliae TaxID=178035 RepID=A0A154PLN4_DUFNO|nr:hypothetical protein WN55_04068 [Dufourea novaeangliae]
MIALNISYCIFSKLSTGIVCPRYVYDCPPQIFVCPPSRIELLITNINNKI